MKTKNEYREYLADMFVKAIEEDGLDWKKGWQGTESPKSAITGATYKGVNRFILEMVSMVNGYEDPRWATFKQIQNQGWSLEKGAKGTQIEFWVPIHPETNKTTTWDTIKTLKENNPEIEIKAVPQYYYVFNAEKIKGIPEREIISNVNIQMENIVPKIASNMGVEILNDGESRAFYRPSEDKVHLPKAESFKTSYDYYATAMHELAHASGAEHRLNRDLSGGFGTSSYAFEELVAEMSSAFMSEHLPYELPEEHLNNHKAYLQSWMKSIKDNPDYLIQAIKKADACANYLEEMGELQQELQKEKNLSFNDITKDTIKQYENINTGEQSMTMTQRYTEALKIAGYEIIPTPKESLATITIRNIETGQELGSDGWGGIIEELDKVEDRTIYEKIEHLLHPPTDMYYYTQHLSGVGLPNENDIVRHPDFQSALEAFGRSDLVDGKTIGVYIEGAHYDLAYYDAALEDFVLDNNITQSNYYEDFVEYISTELSYKDYIDIRENINTINNSLGKDMAHLHILDGVQSVCYEAKSNIITQQNPNGTWAGRIVSDSRPQDYVQFEIMGYDKQQEVTAIFTSVHANDVIGIKELEIKFPEGNFEQAVEQAFYQIEVHFNKDNNLVREAAHNLCTEYNGRCSLYAAFADKTFDEHYTELGDRGYEAFPNYDNVYEREVKKVEILLNEQNEPLQHIDVQDLDEKKTKLIQRVAEYDIEKMNLQEGINNLNNKIENVFKEMAEYDLQTTHSISENTKQLMNLYGLKEMPFLENVQQIDSSKGNIHIFQDKNNSKNNYLGKKIENNGVKVIQRLSDSMDIRTARETLKVAVRQEPENIRQNSLQKTRPLSVGRGLS